MTFLLVILLMIMQNSRGPVKERLLIGREGSQDRVVGNIDDDDDQPERVPAKPKANPVVPAATALGSGGQTMALAQANSGEPAASQSTGDNVAPNTTAPVTESTTAPRQGKGSPSTASPAIPLRFNLPPANAGEAAPAEPQPAPRAAGKSIPPASGPTDEDPDEAGAATEDFDYIDDDTSGIVKPEMPAYERIVRWVTNQSYERMAERSQFKKLNFSQVVAAASERRGKLFQFDMHVRRVTAYDDKFHFYNDDEDPHEPVQLYEMWGDTGESRGRLIQLVVYDPPAGMPIGPSILEDVRFVGYFFKLQGYEPAKAAPGALPLKAPTFIGRVLWMERPPAVLIHQGDVGWIIALGGSVLAILLAFFAWLFFRKARPNVAQIAVDLTIPSVVSIDDWLEHPGPGSSREERNSQHVAPADEETESDPTLNGHGNGHAKLFSDRPDGSHS
jgi:hypothetical protein